MPQLRSMHIIGGDGLHSISLPPCSLWSVLELLLLATAQGKHIRSRHHEPESKLGGPGVGHT